MEIPKSGQWSFEKKEVANNFDKHVREQLPFYDLVTNTITHIVRHYLTVGGVVYDIGASTGNIGIKLKNDIELRQAEFFAIEPSKSMVDIYKGGGILINDKAENVEYKKFDIAICFLVLMFLSIEDRETLIKKLTTKVKKGGCIIIVDKQEPKGGYESIVLSRLALSNKIESGASSDDIIKKELSLSGIQRPLEVDFFDTLNAYCFFRLGDFVGYVIRG
jgi:tRNA (cmo5U34)-methyltransferase